MVFTIFLSTIQEKELKVFFCAAFTLAAASCLFLFNIHVPIKTNPIGYVGTSFCHDALPSDKN